MNIFIAEDEPPARERLVETLARVAPQACVLAHADTVRGTALWLANHAAPDLLLLDIQLADGLSLELFQGRELNIPTIFTTAYNHFAIDAFRALAVDYLLKPVSDSALAAALHKTQRLRQQFGSDVAEVLARLPSPVPRWRQRLVGRQGQMFHALAVNQVAYVVALDKTCVAVTVDGARYGLETPLAELEAELDPAQFFRVNRQTLVAAQAVARFAAVGKGRLKLELRPALQGDVWISQERAAAFKAWIGA